VHLDGLQVPVGVLANRAKDGTYLVVVTVGAVLKGGKAKAGFGVDGEAKSGSAGFGAGGFGGGAGAKGFGGPSFLKLTVLGDEWSLILIVGTKVSAD
jgi:hypothetical protein